MMIESFNRLNYDHSLSPENRNDFSPFNQNKDFSLSREVSNGLLPEANTPHNLMIINELSELNQTQSGSDEDSDQRVDLEPEDEKRKGTNEKELTKSELWIMENN